MELRKKIYLVCGFRETGKDTLYQQMSNKSTISWNWNVWIKPTVENTLNKNSRLVRFAFADQLKREIIDQYNLILNMEKDDCVYEKNKILLYGMFPLTLLFSYLRTTIIPTIPESTELHSNVMDMAINKPDMLIDLIFSNMFPGVSKTDTYRNLLIRHGKQRRKEDVNYWVNIVANFIKETDEDVMITDFRFPNELNRIKELFPDREIYTIRVYRKEVSIPPCIPSEFSLIDLETDYLLTTDDNLDDALNIYPQYGDYKLSELVI